MFWRIGIVLIGILWSVLLWRQQTIQESQSQTQQRNAINSAVTNSNEHSDKTLRTFRDDIQSVLRDMAAGIHSDNSELDGKI